MQRIPHASLQSITTFKTGGTCEELLLVEDESELKEVLQYADQKSLPFHIIGGGSNTLALDGHRKALFITQNKKAISVVRDNTISFLTVSAAYPWDETVQYAVDHGLWGIENLSGIPGSVGGAIVQNIGAYGAVLGTTLHSVRAFDVLRKKVVIFESNNLDLGYRTSTFKKNYGRYIVVEATLKLSSIQNPIVSYDGLRHFASEKKPSLQEIRHTVCTIRSKKFPNLNTYGTAGSFFLNPIVTSDEALQLSRKFPDMPLYGLPEGGVKVPIAWCMDHIVRTHGMRYGKAFVWPQQALVIAAEKGASTHDVLQLAEKISEKVFAVMGIKIFREVCLV